jgi:hypothetical protein
MTRTAACEAPQTRAVDPPDPDSAAAIVRARVRLDLRVAYQIDGDATRGTLHVWNATDSLVAPARLVLVGEPPIWDVLVDDPGGILDPYLLDADGRGAASDARWSECRAEGRTALVCAGLGHEYNYRELRQSRGMSPDLRELEGEALESGLAQLFDSRDPFSIYAGGTELTRQATYAPSTGALIYFHALDTLYSWVMTGEGVAASATTAIDRSSLSRSVAAFREQLASGAGALERAPTRGERFGVRRSPEAEDLASTLLAPSVVQAVVELERLVVVPVLNLGTLPFGALPGPNGYLADDLAISVAPSLWDLFSAYPPTLGYGSSAGLYRSGLVVGNPDFGGEREWSLPKLPGAEAEAAAVASLLDTTPLIGAAATEAAVLQATGVDVYHFATHGVTDQQDPLQGSFLALSGGGRLTAIEIQERGASANGERAWGDLVVMSACQTGLGMTDLGGIIGLARAFQLGGTPNVVMSLWNVDDDATAELMRLFYESLHSGRTPAEALRRASLAVRERHPSPSIWAAFTVLSVQQEVLD